MKHLYNYLLVFFSIYFLVTVPWARPSDNGAERGGYGGGDHIKPEVKLLGYEILGTIRSIPLYSNHFKIPFNELEEKINSANIIPVEKPIYISGKLKTAKNNYHDTIWIHAESWNLITSRVIKKRLIFHEYLSLLKIERDDYYIISNTLYNEYLLPPTLSDLGISNPLSTFERDHYGSLLPTDLFNDSLAIPRLNKVFQLAVEDLLNLYQIIFLKFDYLKNTNFIEQLWLNINLISEWTNLFVPLAMEKLSENGSGNQINLINSSLKLRYIQYAVTSLEIYQLLLLAPKFNAINLNQFGIPELKVPNLTYDEKVEIYKRNLQLRKIITEELTTLRFVILRVDNIQQVKDAEKLYRAFLFYLDKI